MNHTPELGIAAPELGWVPSPTWALRRLAVLEHVWSWPPGRVLDMGCGAGALLHDLARRGFTGLGVEVSDAARELGEKLAGDLDGFRISDRIPGDSPSFDYLVSLEVLEHIEDDCGALSSWLTHLKAGGQVLLSVPADPKRWDVTDVLAGHYRRYDRESVVDLVAGVGLHVDRIETYGFPATWLIARVRRAVREAQVRRRGLDVAAIETGDVDRTKRSGIERSVETRLFPLYGSWAGRRLLSAAARLQRLFRDTDRGISYLVMAHK
jgi:SAM-dependent methyltransferase